MDAGQIERSIKYQFLATGENNSVISQYTVCITICTFILTVSIFAAHLDLYNICLLPVLATLIIFYTKEKRKQGREKLEKIWQKKVLEGER